MIILIKIRDADGRKRPVVSKIAWYTVRIRLIRKGTKREKQEEIQDINTYTNTNLIPSQRFRSAHYPITHKALITQLISIYLITPSLPGTISISPGRESPSPRIPLPPLSNLSCSAITRLSLSLAALSILLANRRHAPAIRIPAECESLAWTCAANASWS